MDGGATIHLADYMLLTQYKFKLANKQYFGYHSPKCTNAAHPIAIYMPGIYADDYIDVGSAVHAWSN